MPLKPLRPCGRCKQLHNQKRCPICEPERRKQSASRREQEHLHLYSTDWKKLRLMILMEQPLCVECKSHGRLTPASVIDHVTPHKGDMALFYDRSNLQSLCTSCHSAKTAREDGGFGNTESVKASKSCSVDGLPIDSRHHWNR